MQTNITLNHLQEKDTAKRMAQEGLLEIIDFHPAAILDYLLKEALISKETKDALGCYSENLRLSSSRTDMAHALASSFFDEKHYLDFKNQKIYIIKKDRN